MTYTKNDIFEGMRFEVSNHKYEITNIKETVCKLTRIELKKNDTAWSKDDYVINDILQNLNNGTYKPYGCQPEVVRNNYTIF